MTAADNFNDIINTKNIFVFFFFNDTATTEIYTLSLHDALPIFDEAFVETLIELRSNAGASLARYTVLLDPPGYKAASRDRKSTRLNSSHGYISYAVFCLKKKKHIDILRYLEHENRSLK